MCLRHGKAVDSTGENQSRCHAQAGALALSHSARACPADSSRRARAAAVHRSRVRARKKDGEKFYPVAKVWLENHKAIYDSINVHGDRPKRSLRGIQE